MATQREPVTLRRIVGGKGGVLFALICGLLAALCLVYGIANLRAARQSVDWPGTHGEIVHSEVEEHISVHKDEKGQSTTTVTYASNVLYRYRVGGEEYFGSRVRFDWEQDRAAAEATVAKYPEGTIVSVYYDRADPSRAVLEPGGDAFVYKVVIGLGVFFLAIPTLWFAIRAWVLVRLPGFRIRVDRNMASKVDSAKGLRAKWQACNWIQKTALVIAVPLLGLALLGWISLSAYVLSLGIDGYRHPDISQHWTETSGLVAMSEMKPILVKRSGSSEASTYYRYDLRFVIEYRVLANRYTLDLSTSFRDEEAARAMLARYQRGSYVSVYYDPDDPGDGTLTPEEPIGMGFIVIGSLMLAPWFFTGLGLLGWWLKVRYLSPSRPAGAA